MTRRFEGRVALVTGGASGIGAGVARRLAAGGARVVIADIDATAGPAVAGDVDGHWVRADVALQEDNRSAVAAAVERYGRLDIAFLNAGVSGEGNLVEDLDADRYRRMRAVNLDAVVYGVHAVRGQLAAQGGGTIIVTSSLAGLYESALDPLYSATKHAVVGLVRSVAHVLAAEGITINALCPTFVDTPMLGDAVPLVLQAGVAVLEVARVADAVDAIIAAGTTGQAWPVLPHDPPAPFAFAAAPDLLLAGTRHDAGPPR
ncbi:MAG TPA: SDR family NAD(P)-dependent oxidoreductase [Euzebyales bacterium]|nr:SDR family NAD(P)-dependent oxidoreductase [Euzebyales bacterium]